MLMNMRSLSIGLKVIRSVTVLLTLLAITLPSLVVTTSAEEEQSGNIATVAGTGTCGYSGDGGSGANAQVSGLAGLATDAEGNLYISETANHVVRKVTPFGTISTFAGSPGIAKYNGDNGPAERAQLAAPTGVVVDSTSRLLYIADLGNHRVRRVDLATRIITTFAGTGEAGFSGDGGPAVQAKLQNPNALAMDNAGNLYISDYLNNRIRKVDQGGTITTFAGNGSRGDCGDGGPATAACLKDVKALAVTPTGLMLGAMNSNRVRRVDGAGTITTIVGEGSYLPPAIPGPANGNTINWPDGLASDSFGNLYIALFAGNIVLRMTPDGWLTAVAGTGFAGYNGDNRPAAQAQLKGPTGLAIDRFGNLYISDSGNCRVRKVRVQ